MLIPLTIAFRAIGIHHLNTERMDRSQKQYIFAYSKLQKGWRIGQVPCTLKLYTYNENPRLCVVQCIDEYLLGTRDWRSEGKTQLLISFISPHNEITRSTISNWIKENLRLSGIDSLGDFGEHSNRSYSTSKADLAGL